MKFKFKEKILEANLSSTSLLSLKKLEEYLKEKLEQHNIFVNMRKDNSGIVFSSKRESLITCMLEIANNSIFYSEIDVNDKVTVTRQDYPLEEIQSLTEDIIKKIKLVFNNYSVDTLIGKQKQLQDISQVNESGIGDWFKKHFTKAGREVAKAEQELANAQQQSQDEMKSLLQAVQETITENVMPLIKNSALTLVTKMESATKIKFTLACKYLLDVDMSETEGVLNISALQSPCDSTKQRVDLSINAFLSKLQPFFHIELPEVSTNKEAPETKQEPDNNVSYLDNIKNILQDVLPNTKENLQEAVKNLPETTWKKFDDILNNINKKTDTKEKDSQRKALFKWCLYELTSHEMTDEKIQPMDFEDLFYAVFEKRPSYSDAKGSIIRVAKYFVKNKSLPTKAAETLINPPKYILINNSKEKKDCESILYIPSLYDNPEKDTLIYLWCSEAFDRDEIIKINDRLKKSKDIRDETADRDFYLVRDQLSEIDIEIPKTKEINRHRICLIDKNTFRSLEIIKKAKTILTSEEARRRRRLKSDSEEGTTVNKNKTVNTTTININNPPDDAESLKMFLYQLGQLDYDPKMMSKEQAENILFNVGNNNLADSNVLKQRAQKGLRYLYAIAKGFSDYQKAQQKVDGDDIKWQVVQHIARNEQSDENNNS